MWQRIQTLYLAISTILIAVVAFGTKAVTVGPEGEVAETVKYMAYIPYAILIVLILILDILALTTYKIRVFQMRTAMLSAIITLALQIWLVVDFIANRGTGLVFRMTAIFPFVSIILNLLAARAILADEMLVESAYRLRSSKRKRLRK